MPDTPRSPRGDGRHPWFVAAIIVAAAAVVAAGAVLAVSKVGGPSSAGAAAVAKPLLTVVSSQPTTGSAEVAPDATLAVNFDDPLSSGSPLPTLDPSVAGTWVHTAPTTLAFEASSPLPPGATETVTVPGGSNGIVGAAGEHLNETQTIQFSVAPLSTLRVQQLLAELGYLPLSFTPADTSPVAPADMAVAQVGTFSWKWDTLPDALTDLWSPGVSNVVTQGAIMAFESQHNLKTDGIAGPEVWQALLASLSSGTVDSYPYYDWASVSTSLPEHLDMWRDGQVVYTTLANTGIEAAPTEEGTWPVYARYITTTMMGTNPDGTTYNDPGVPWVSYFHGGDALHGFNRSSYGYPQSLGCVEMPPSHAGVVFPYTPIGTLVTVA
jgi:peptidoglycan hydrolase-like protein with peptidoglycan-binding domain